MSGLGKVLLIVVLAASASAAEQAGALKQYLIEQVKGGTKPVLPVKTGPGKATPTTILATNEAGLKVNAQGAELNLTWKMIGEEGLYEMVAPLMPDAPAATHAAYLEWGIQLGRTKDAGFQKLLEKLYEKDGAAARKIESALKAPAAGAAPAGPAAPADAAAGQTASGNGKAPASDDLARLLGSVTGRDGKVDRGAYLREALGADLQTINRMLGPDYEYFHKGAKPEEFPTLPAATDQSTGKIGRNGKGFTYQFGTPVADPGGYWSTEGQLLYVPDKPGDPGVDRVDVASYGHHCLQLKPEHAWWGGAHPEPGVKQKAWLEAAGGSLGQPFDIERAYWSFSENGFMLFKSGLLAAGAVCNIYTYPFFMFPRHKVPMAVALTHKNEFALVAVWDTQELKGQLAVFALGAVENHEKPKTAWALPGWGVIAKVKLLGYVDLPGLAAPSAVSVTVNNTAVLSPVSFNEHNLDDQALRDKNYKGSDREQTASAGCAVLISRSENKIAVVDLRPLFTYLPRDVLHDRRERGEDEGLRTGPEAVAVHVRGRTARQAAGGGRAGRPAAGVAAHVALRPQRPSGARGGRQPGRAALRLRHLGLHQGPHQGPARRGAGHQALRAGEGRAQPVLHRRAALRRPLPAGHAGLGRRRLVQHELHLPGLLPGRPGDRLGRDHEERRRGLPAAPRLADRGPGQLPANPHQQPGRRVPRDHRGFQRPQAPELPRRRRAD